METTINTIIRWVAGPVLGCILLTAGCSSNEPSGGDETSVEFNTVQLLIGDSQGEPASGTRAVSGFAVNTSYDPTYMFDEKLGWSLNLSVYKGSSPYAEGSGTFAWDGTYWTSSSTLYMPNYLMQSVEATLTPASWTGAVVSDQRDRTTFVEQDLLEQNGTPTYTTAPAHYLEVEMRHSHAMIDFVLDEVNPDDIASVTVDAGGVTYQPFKVPGVSRMEYMVILPLGISKPVIRVATNAGARYSKELSINSTSVNTCYYVRLIGLELTLQAISVSNWSFGQAVAGDYTSPTSYPTFRGPAKSQATLYYNNGLDQTMTFNENGIAVEKPAGRTIIAVETSAGRYDLPTPYTIRNMIVDLNNYIDAIGT